MNKMLIAIYLLFDADGNPRYVGKSVNPKRRFCEHKKKKGWPASFEILEWVSIENWEDRERYWISHCKQIFTTIENIFNGGAPHYTEETRKLLSAIQLRPEILAKTMAPHIGSKHSEATKLKMSASAKGKVKSKEHRDHIGDAQRGKTKIFTKPRRPCTDAEKLVISSNLRLRKGLPHRPSSQETKDNISAGLRAAHAARRRA